MPEGIADPGRVDGIAARQQTNEPIKMTDYRHEMPDRQAILDARWKAKKVDVPGGLTEEQYYRAKERAAEKNREAEKALRDTEKNDAQDDSPAENSDSPEVAEDIAYPANAIWDLGHKKIPCAVQGPAKQRADGSFFYEVIVDAGHRAEISSSQIHIHEQSVPQPEMPPDQEDKYSDSIAWSYLSYADVLDEPTRSEAIETNRQSPNAQKYKEALQEVVMTIGVGALNGLVSRMKDTCFYEIIEYGIDPSKYMNSQSWAVWDIAKQYYYSKHPNETTEEYRDSSEGAAVGNPLLNNEEGDRKREEIINRHLGWEIDLAVSQGRLDISKLPMEVRDIIITGDRNSTGQLRSFELAKLGQKLRRKKTLQ